jgi:amino acid adenylation domain-containing protein
VRAALGAPEPATGPAPVLPVVVDLRGEPAAPPVGPDRFEPLPAGQGMTSDLRITVAGADITVDYAIDIFDRDRVERLAGHLQILLAGAAADPGTPISALPLLTSVEQERLVTDWQGPPTPYSREPVHRQIAAHAAARPDAVALRFGDDEVTYAELDRRAAELARRLRADGTRHGDIVAICLDRGIDVVVAMLGVLRAGGAFAVLDPTYPVRRLQFLIDDTATRTVLTHTAHLPALPPPAGWSPLCLDRDWSAIAAQPAGRDLPEWADESSLAYVLYTSGSTGQPKGVLIEHGCLSNFVRWPVWLFGLGPGDRMLQHMTLIFDFSEGEIFTALTAGATLVIAPEATRTSPTAFARLLADERITCLFGPPAVLAKVDPGDCPDLRYVTVGGDICTGELVNRWNTPGRRFINGYGPTEATVGCTAYECEHRDWTAPPPIGRPMPNRTAYILDATGRLCPIGVPGELHIGGAGVARGYLNRPDLTREKFLADPFRPGGRMYRTGDLAAWTADGQIQFLGRIDTQVKVNGLRVELEEIEAALEMHPSVAQAAVSVRDDATGTRRLVAHVVPAGAAVDPAVLRLHLSDLLPAFLVPGQMFPLDALPLTPVGKVDRARLRELAGAESGAAAFRSARTPLERQVAAVLAEVLGRDAVGVDDLIFDLGGTSLSVVVFTERINRELRAALRPRQVYEEGTVAGVCRLLAEAAESARVAPAPAAPERDALDLLARIEAMSGDDVHLTNRGPA